MVRVATPWVNVATALSENPRIDAYLAGGLVRHMSLGTTGDFVERMLTAINADTAYISADGFTTQDGLTFSYEADAKIARIMSAKASQTVVLATERKLKQRDRITALPASEVDLLITDCQDEKILEPIRDSGVRVLVATMEQHGGNNVQTLPLQAGKTQ